MVTTKGVSHMSIGRLRAHAHTTGVPLATLIEQAAVEYCKRHKVTDQVAPPGKRIRVRQGLAGDQILTQLATGPKAWLDLVARIQKRHPHFGSRSARLAREALQQGGKILKMKDGKRTVWALVGE
jgi:hypothetical protein